MRQLVLASLSADQLLLTARRIVGNQPQPQQALARWLRTRVLFVADPRVQETLTRPAVLLAQVEAQGWAGGDCDDLAILAGALAGAVGLRVRFAVARFAPGGPWAHVWAESSADDGVSWFDFDTFKPYPAPEPVQVGYVNVI